MTPKERAAMQQALEALEIYGEHAKDCPQWPTYTNPENYPKCDCGFDEAITALREALAEPAEQEPVGCCEDTAACIESGICIARHTPPVRTKDLTDDVCDEIIKMAEKECGVSTNGWDCLDPRFIVRAVIAADREKNK